MPEASAVLVAVAAPVRETVDPTPPVIVPEMLQVGAAAAVKLTPAALAPETVTARFGGVNTDPVLVGVTV